jgi:hypothetical protein
MNRLVLHDCGMKGLGGLGWEARQRALVGSVRFLCGEQWKK